MDHTTLNRWVQHYPPEIEKRLRGAWRHPGRSARWHLDEMYVKVKGRWVYLYRAVDATGNTIDFYLSPTRSAKAAGCFRGKALNGCKDWEKPSVTSTSTT